MSYRQIITGEKIMEICLNKFNKKNGRYALLDTVRGVALINMILFHGSWNLVYLYGVEWEWFRSGRGAHLWQQMICQTFIGLAGFCFLLSKHKLKNGVLVSSCGALVTLVTALVMPLNIVLFGVLTCIGSCILITLLLERILRKINPSVGCVLSILLFLYTKKINSGYLGLGRFFIIMLPKEWYDNLFTAYLGFPPASFYSTDYFSLFPWIFLFWTGLFLYLILKNSSLWSHTIMKLSLPVVTLLGKHSLFVYMIHQPVLFLLGEISYFFLKI